jgi:signal transduction histidine kinase/CheY-like chemotaxis protein
MGVDEGSLGEIRTALSGITRRLDALAGLLGNLGAGSEPAGVLLDEAQRARLAPLLHLRALGHGTSREETLRLAVDRALEHGLADAAALLVPTGDGRLRAVAARGFPLDPDLQPGAGIAGRALATGEIVRADPTPAGGDALLAAHGMAAGAALPLLDAGGAACGVLLVGRRRPVPVDVPCLERLLVLGERVAVWLGPAGSIGRAPASAAAPGPDLGVRFPDLDLERTTRAVAAEVARETGASAVAVLLPVGEGIELAAGLGLPPDAVAPSPVAEGLRAAMASQRAWTAARDAEARALDECLGPAPGPRRVVPVVAGEIVVALLLLAGPGGEGALPSEALLAEAAVAIRNARLHAEATRALAELRALRPGGQRVRPPHDFASLLAVVLGRLAAARERATDAGVARDLAVAEEAAWRAAEAVRGLLGYASGGDAARLEPVDLAAVVRERVAAATGRWMEGGGPSPEVHLDLATVPPVRGSADDLRDVVDHLLENAREASPGAEPIVVRLRWDGGGRVELDVEDRGAGMDEATRVRAPDPFFTTKGPGRLGLGLAVAQAVAVRHHGTLEVASRAGRGTSVRLTLPSAGRALEGPLRRRPSLRVLVVEDEPSVRDMLVQALAEDGHAVRGVADGAAALSALAEEPVDVLVTDLALPGLSGLEVARAARGAQPDATVLLVTAWPGQVDRPDLARHGVDLVLEKPVGLGELRTAIERFLARRDAGRR